MDDLVLTKRRARLALNTTAAHRARRATFNYINWLLLLIPSCSSPTFLPLPLLTRPGCAVPKYCTLKRPTATEVITVSGRG